MGIFPNQNVNRRLFPYSLVSCSHLLQILKNIEIHRKIGKKLVINEIDRKKNEETYLKQY